MTFGNLQQSLAIFGDLWQSSGIFCDFLRSLPFFGDLWKSSAIFGNFSRSSAIISHHSWLWAIFVYLQRSAVVSGDLWWSYAIFSDLQSSLVIFCDLHRSGLRQHRIKNMSSDFKHTRRPRLDQTEALFDEDGYLSLQEWESVWMIRRLCLATRRPCLINRHGALFLMRTQRHSFWMFQTDICVSN